MPPQDTTVSQDQKPKLPPGASLAPPSLRLPPGATIDPRGKMAQKFYVAGRGQQLSNLWSSMSGEEKEQTMNNLSVSGKADLMDQLKLFGHATSVSAAPEFNYGTVENILTGKIDEDPWVRQKVTNLIYKTHNYLPTVGGTLGGIGGGIAGELLVPPGGGAVGAVLGAGIGGAIGEAGRQGVEKIMGWEDEPVDAGDRAGKIAKEGTWQSVYELPGLAIGRLIRPSMSKSIAKLYYAGGLDVGDRRVKGAVEQVYRDLERVEKTGAGKATTVSDFIDVLDETKRQIGAEVDSAYMQPITQNGRQVMLGAAHADTTGLQNAINALRTKNPSIVKEAALNPQGKAAAYLKRITEEAEKYQKAMWTYSELADKRILLNQDLDALYSMPRGEQRAYLLDHPDLQIAKEEADAIRDITYPQMDIASGRPVGTTLALQSKRGIIMDLSTDAEKHLRSLGTASRVSSGTPLGERINVSTYGTSTGHPGLAAHRLHRLLPGRKTEEQVAGKQVARAFGHTGGTKVARATSSRTGREVWNLPLRALFPGDKPILDSQSDDDSDLPGTDSPQQGASGDASAGGNMGDAPLSKSDVYTGIGGLPQLSAEAQQRNPSSPANQANKTYRQTATNHKTGHRIGTDDGVQWFDVQTGQRVK